MERNGGNPVRNHPVNDERVHNRQYMTQRIAEFARRDPRILDMIEQVHIDREQRMRQAEEQANTPAKAA